MNNSTPTFGMLDPTCINVSDIDTLFKPMETDLFQQLYLSMTNHVDNNPGLLTPMENDWHQLDLLDSNRQNDSFQDMFLTSPNSLNDNTLLTPTSSPEVLFNSLVDTTFQLPTTTTTTVPTTTINDNNENKKKHKTTQKSSSSPLEMMLTLDAPLKSSLSKDKSKKKMMPPAASLPVTSHIMSASTPTFTLKQVNNKKRSHSTLSSSMVLNNKKDSSSMNQNTTKMENENDSTMNSSSPSSSDITVELALKRQRNTDAARRSRLRKVQKMETLSTRVNELETIHQQLLIRLATLETDKSILLKNETNYQSRIEQLESELTNAHVKLSQL